MASVLVAAALTAPALSAAAAPPTSGSGGYDEPYRPPQFHYTLPTGWIGDPNGLVYDAGQYYLFSFGTWKGATSKDLVHWTDIPVTGPQHDAGSSTFFSGSAVIDTQNTSGFGTTKNPPDGRDVHQRAGRHEHREAVHRLQHGQGPHVDAIRRQPCARPELGELPGPEGVLV